MSIFTREILSIEFAGYLLLNGEKNRPNKEDAFRAFACVIDYMFFCDENTTVNGVASIADLGHYSLTLEGFVTMEERRDFIQTWQVRIDVLHS